MTTHYGLVGDYGKPLACGTLMVSNVPMTNRWPRVTCTDCLGVKDDKSKDRPDRVTNREYRERRKTASR